MYSEIKSIVHNIYYASLGKSGQVEGPRFIIFAQGRSGSTALADLLNNHHSIRCEGELLMNYKLFPLEFLEGKSRPHVEEGRVWGCKIKWWHIAEVQHREVNIFLRALRSRGWKIIYLHRENYLFQALSTLAGEVRESWRHKHGEGIKSVNIDPEKIEDYVISRENQTKVELEALSEVSYEKVVYERDLYDPKSHQSTYDVHLDEGIRGPVRHYVGAVRHLMYKEGIRRLKRDGMMDVEYA